MVELDPYQQIDSVHYNVVVTVNELPAGAIVIHELYNAGGNQIIESGDTLLNMRVEDWVRVFYNNNDIAWTYLKPETFTYEITSYTPPTSPLNADGAIEITFQPTTFHSWCDMQGVVASNAASPLAFTTSDSLTFRAVGLAQGYFTGYVMGCNDALYNNTFRIHVGDPDFSLGNLSLGYSLVIDDETDSCDASVVITPLDAQGPVSYLWNDTDIPDTAAWDQFCPGYYKALMTDAASNTGLVEFLIIDSDNVFTINTPDSSANDSIKVVFHNCDFDYAVPIDSIHYSQEVDTVNFFQHYVHFWLVVYNGSDSTLLEASFFTPNYHNVLLSAYIYCVSAEKMAFRGRKIVVDTHEGLTQHTETEEPEEPEEPEQPEEPTNGIGEAGAASVRPFPNPTTGKLSLGISCKGALVDNLGQQLFAFEGSELSLASLDAGIYFLVIEGTPGACRIVKQ